MMIECRNCREVFHDEKEIQSSRCPFCRMPMFDRPERERPRSHRESERGVCAVHPNNEAVGVCKRCGTFMCALCRTRWQDRPICLSCVEHILEPSAANPQQAAEHRKLANLSLWLGITGWMCAILGAVGAATIAHARANAELATMGGLLIMVSIFPALFSVGQGAAAIRLRGDRMIYATSGLLLSATQLGVFVGLVLLNLWHEL